VIEEANNRGGHTSLVSIEEDSQSDRGALIEETNHP
jgi:hypothetical protein